MARSSRAMTGNEENAMPDETPRGASPPPLAGEGREGAAPPEAPFALAAEIDAWFASHFHNSVVSRDTEVFNHVRAAVDELKVRLTQL
jgi:hypothetical protein